MFSSWPINQTLEVSGSGFQLGGSEQILSSSLCLILSQVLRPDWAFPSFQCLDDGGSDTLLLTALSQTEFGINFQVL